MNRRSFLQSLGAVVAGLALGEAIPFNRVWSFPSKIVIVENRLLTPEFITREVLMVLKKNLVFESAVRFDDQHQCYQFKEAA